MSQRIIKLEQYRESYNSPTSPNLNEVEEGDEVGGYRVISVEEQECPHPSMRWSVDEQTSEEPPTVTGTCRTCGEEKKYDLEEERQSRF